MDGSIYTQNFIRLTDEFFVSFQVPHSAWANENTFIPAFHPEEVLSSTVTAISNSTVCPVSLLEERCISLGEFHLISSTASTKSRSTSLTKSFISIGF